MRIFKKTLFLQTMLLLSIHVLLLPISANAQDATISQMVATYNANQARFHAQHRGKVISGVGTVKSIEADLLGTGTSFNVVLDISKSRVDCRTQNKSVAASLDKGQKINFRGTVYDVVVGTLIATECSFSSVESQPQISNSKSQQDFSGDKLNNGKDRLRVLFPSIDINRVFADIGAESFLLKNGWKRLKIACGPESETRCFIKQDIRIQLFIVGQGFNAGKVHEIWVIDYKRDNPLWVEVTEEGIGFRTFVNLASERIDDRIVTFEILRDFETRTSEGKSFIIKLQVDCNTRRLRRVSHHGFSESLGRGSRYEINSGRDWHSPTDYESYVRSYPNSSCS